MKAHRILCLAVTVVLLTVSAQADILILTDGTAVNTDGPWEQKGKLVVFKMKSGGLASLPVEEIDFEATERYRNPPAEEATPTMSWAAAASPPSWFPANTAGERASATAVMRM